MTKIRVVAAVVDTQQLTLYKEDGETVFIMQGDPRLKRVIDEITPRISRGLVATVDVSSENTYNTFEKETGGIVRFFKVAKQKVASLFGASEEVGEGISIVEPMELGHIPSRARGLTEAVNDIMAHATPASSPSFGSDQTSPSDTVVAVMDGKVIPGMENLKDQFAYALKLGSTKGVQNFLKRISAVIYNRQHTIQELLNFMQRGDLPIADDGSIIAYKVLRSTPKVGNVVAKGEGIYYDPHTGRVPQRVGSYVCQDKVNPNRRTECSTGLHIARRGYLSWFPGDKIMLVKVAPEDVIAVPYSEPNKMRARGYHIVAEIPAKYHEDLRANRAMTRESEAQILLGKAIAGDHIGRIEEVRITGTYGNGVQITPIKDGKLVTSKKKVAPAKAVAIDEKASVSPSVDPKAVAKQVTQEKAAKATPKTKAEQARQLYVGGHISELREFKKAAKKGWKALGFTAEEVSLIEGTKGDSPVANGQPARRPNMTKEEVAKQEKLVSEMAPIQEEIEASGYDDPQPGSEPAKTYPDTVAGQARKLFDEKKWGQLYDFKKAKKKSWSVLGFSDAEAEITLANKPK